MATFVTVKTYRYDVDELSFSYIRYKSIYVTGIKILVCSTKLVVMYRQTAVKQIISRKKTSNCTYTLNVIHNVHRGYELLKYVSTLSKILL